MTLDLLFSLLLIAPITSLNDGPLALGAWSAVLATGLILAGRALRPGEAAHLGALLRPLALGALIPALVMLIQAMPLPVFGRFANPIWESAASALGHPLTPSLTINTGATLLALYRYMAWLGIGLLACVLTLDRRRAERVMFAATAITVMLAVLLIINDAFGLTLLAPAHAISRAAALDSAALGLILSAACIDRAYERFETRRTRDPRSMSRLVRNLSICAASFILCAVGLSWADPRNALFAAAAGLAIFVGVVVTRRFGFGIGSMFTIAVLGCLLVVALFADGTNQRDADFTVKYASSSSLSKSMTGRMLADNTLTGSGAGTFHDLVPIYRGLDDSSGNLDPPTAAAAVALEFGRPGLWIAVLAALAMLVSLVRAALRRGRDSFYPASGAGVLIALLIAAFGNPGLLGSAVLILSGTILGLAFAQSRSRTAQ